MRYYRLVLAALMVSLLLQLLITVEPACEIVIAKPKELSEETPDILCLGSVGTNVDGSITVRRVGVFFKGVAEAVAYNIYRRTDNEVGYVLIGSIHGETHYVDSGVFENHSYVYFVTFLNRLDFKESGPGASGTISLPDKQIMINWGPNKPGRGPSVVWDDISECKNKVTQTSTTQEKPK